MIMIKNVTLVILSPMVVPKDALMNNARLELDSWLQQNRRLTEERDKLLTRVELLKRLACVCTHTRD